MSRGILCLTGACDLLQWSQSSGIGSESEDFRYMGRCQQRNGRRDGGKVGRENKTTAGLAITGIEVRMGTPEKPVGLVYVAASLNGD